MFLSESIGGLVINISLGANRHLEITKDNCTIYIGNVKSIIDKGNEICFVDMNNIHYKYTKHTTLTSF
jgi:hypothetical protein